MSDPDFPPFSDMHRSDWVRLHTLVGLRWFVAIGQAVGIIVAVRIYGLQIEIGYASIVVGTATLANLVCAIIYPENKRLSEHEAALWLAFDICQLAALLFLTGGLNNPFAVLLLAPVTIAATLLRLRSAVLISGLATLVITLVALWHLPVRATDGSELILPQSFLFGFWVALTSSAIFMAIYSRQVTTEMHAMGDALVATQLALAREQKLTDLGGVVAATAHELGTPLATIKLVASELMEELEDRPALREDATLLREQADRCRDILHSMGRAGKDDLMVHNAPLETVVREAAEPHLNRGTHVIFDVGPVRGAGPAQPSIERRPEIIHGLRNLIQNAVDFAADTVEIAVEWDENTISIRLCDDGPGFPPALIGRIGEPSLPHRWQKIPRHHRPGYKGMGLGLFIAKTLLERTGARLSFSNLPKGETGAVVRVTWDRASLAERAEVAARPLGINQPFDTEGRAEPA